MRPCVNTHFGTSLDGGYLLSVICYVHGAGCRGVHLEWDADLFLFGSEGRVPKPSKCAPYSEGRVPKPSKCAPYSVSGHVRTCSARMCVFLYCSVFPAQGASCHVLASAVRDLNKKSGCARPRGCVGSVGWVFGCGPSRC